MDNNNISIQERTKTFAVRCVKAYCELNNRHYDDAGKVLAKQFLRSSTSIGANVSESEFAESTSDYIHKLRIALKEAGETRFWVDLMIESKLIQAQKFSLLLEENNRIIRILIHIINKIESKQKQAR